MDDADAADRAEGRRTGSGCGDADRNAVAMNSDSGAVHGETAATRAVYDASADYYAQVVGTELNATVETTEDRAFLRAFVDRVAAAGGRRVADVGCGPGRAGAVAAAAGLDVTGVDLSPAMLAIGRRSHPTIAFAEGRIDALPIADGATHCVISWYSIIHTTPQDLDAVFVEWRRVLAPGCPVLLAFQAGTGEASRRSDAYGTALTLTSFRHASADVGARLEGAGFDVEDRVERQAELAHESAPQAFVVARRPA